ncbi:MAG: cation transporter [Paludibacteraceae bacterium]|nr:cation transporter [Paludibacteraceae bacterium]
MKRFLIIWMALLPIMGVLAAKPNKQVVTLSCELHCQGCCDKIMKNIAFEKGVKDIVCDLPSQTVTVTYNADKTDVPTLLKAFEKIGKPAKVKEEKNNPSPTRDDAHNDGSGAQKLY